jgi:putative transposase
MIFKEGYIYHIYNQGNNRGMIFFKRENYLFFLRKIKQHVLPYADILAWCLMPNHFHLMVYVKESEYKSECDSKSRPDYIAAYPKSRPDFSTLNKSIGIMLSSYTRAINIQENRSGSLFRSETKAICLNEISSITPSWFKTSGITYFNNKLPEKEYPQVCFSYIHQNPVNAGFVNAPEEWEFSSYADCIGLRDGTLINKTRIKEFGLI